MKNILVMNFGGIGDEILFLPVLKSLKEEFKDCRITLCLEKRSSAVADLTNLIDGMLFADIKKRGFGKYVEILRLLLNINVCNFDIVISSGSSPLVAILLYLTGIKRRIGYKSLTSFLLTDVISLNKNQYASNMYHDLVKTLTDRSCDLPQISIKDEDSVNCFLNENFLSEGFVALHPGVSKMSIRKGIYKTPDTSFWVNLIKGLLDKGKKVVLLGGADDREIISEIISKVDKNDKFLNLAEKTKNISDMAKIINKASCFICADSAPMHVSVALNKKTFAIFAPTDEKKLIPQNDNFVVIQNDTQCRPCLWDVRQTSCDNPRCLNINVNQILDKI